ncbi:MAG: hypothetical protein NTZ05_13810 [Chloroflexi bacterium]|nr:hypothetical protein [Chloroflexota bacterium]
MKELTRYSKSVLRGYLERSLDDLGMIALLEMIDIAPESGEIRAMLQHIVDHWITAEVMNEDLTVFKRAEAVLASYRDNGQPTEQFDTPEGDPAEQILAFQCMRAAMLAALLGDANGVRHLAALLATAPLNWQLDLSYFLGNLTNGWIGTMYQEIPRQKQTLLWLQEWTSANRERAWAGISRLPEIAPAGAKVH